MSEIIRTGVIGHPVAHSKSPVIHGYWLKKYGLAGSYEAIDVRPESLERDVRELVEAGFRGFNLTVPHKALIIPFCDQIDEGARAIGAVNTVVVEAGRLIGRNTDAYGFIQNLRESAPDFALKDKVALVIGAGGAAKAVVHGLVEEGVGEVVIVNRTFETASVLAGAYPNVRALDWEARESVLADVDLVVNTSVLGMAGKPALALDLKDLNPEALVCDIVYAPLQTYLLRCAAARGNPVVSGIGMLLHQARPAFEAWYGVMPEVDQGLQDLVLS